MAKCKECIHERVCVIKAFPEAFENTGWDKEPCDHFKRKADFEPKTFGWVMIPVGGAVNYRCGNIDCCRLIPFGKQPSEMAYCPYCGAKMKGGGE